MPGLQQQGASEGKLGDRCFPFLVSSLRQHDSCTVLAGLLKGASLAWAWLHYLLIAVSFVCVCQKNGGGTPLGSQHGLFWCVPPKLCLALGWVVEFPSPSPSTEVLTVSVSRSPGCFWISLPRQEGHGLESHRCLGFPALLPVELLGQKLRGEVVCYRACVHCATPEACSVPVCVGKQVNSPAADVSTHTF